MFDRCTMSADSTEGTKILQPTQYDVLFGRGKPFQGHAGNIRLHKVVDVYKGRYSQARRHEKTEIAEEIVQFIKNGSAKAGRFLKRLEGEECWVEVSDSIARDKVSHALRGKPRKEDALTKSTDGSVDHREIDSKRSIEVSEAESPAPQPKRQKCAPEVLPSDLELLAAQRNSMMLPQLSSNAALLASAGYGSTLPYDIRAQLVSSALAERQLALGPLNSQFVNLQGALGHSHGFMDPLLSNHMLVNPLLHTLRTDRSALDSLRLW